MKRNAAHASLKKWFEEILSLLEDRRYRSKPVGKKFSPPGELFEAFKLGPVVRKARKELGKDHPVLELIEETKENIDKGIKRLQELYSNLLMSAGIGHLVDMVIHEIGAPLGRINNQLALIERRLGKSLDEDEKEIIFPRIEIMKANLEAILNFRRRLDPQTPGKRGRATTFSVRDEIEDNFQLYSSLINKQGIDYKIYAPGNLR